jgi:hypothetical protein
MVLLLRIMAAQETANYACCGWQVLPASTSLYVFRAEDANHAKAATTG